MTPNTTARSLLGAALLACAFAAQAGTTASASFTNLQWQLIDLDPDDGVAPSIEFDSPGGMTTLTGQTPDDGRWSFWTSLGNYRSDGSLATVSSVRAHPEGSALDTISRDSTALTATSANLQVHFSLAPHSELVLSGDVHLGLDNPVSGQASSTSVSASTYGYDNVGNLLSSQSITRTTAGADDVRLYSYFINTTDSNSIGSYFSITASSTAAVPEPGSPALLLAGLGALGLAARRRNRRR